MMQRAGIALIAAMIASLPAQGADDSIETPPYEVVATYDGMEVRDYAPMLVAEVDVEAPTARDAASMGFRPLAGYIFGGNRSGTEIAMTAPVMTQGPSTKDPDSALVLATSAAGDGPVTWTVQFTMPSQWTMETLPTPRDGSVRLREVPARTVAAVAYTGDDPARREAAGEELLANVDAAGLEIAGPVTIAGYDGPSVPQAERRWEAMVEVRR